MPAVLRYLIPLLAILGTSVALAERPVEGEDQTAIFSELWRSVELTGDRDDFEFPFIKLRGRYHGQLFAVDGDGDNDTDWENRRIRFGLDIVFTEKLEFAFDLNMRRNSGTPLVDNFDFLALNYAFNDNTALSIGKLRRNPLTREDSISSNRILTIERSLLTSRFFVDNTGGIFLVHEQGDWAFGGGVLTGSTEEDLALPTLEGGLFFKGNVAHRITPITEIRLDYLYNTGNSDNTDVEPYRHIVSLNSYTRSGRWGLITDLIYAEALPQARGDLFGFVILPHYMLTDRLQIVGRYTWSGSDEDNGIRLLNRYERRAVPDGDEFGDRHQAVYLGLNYYFYGHKLKLMSGVEYTDFDSLSGDTSVLTANAALRFYF
ncbi:MAG: porin [Pseudomonadota bacterium]